MKHIKLFEEFVNETARYDRPLAAGFKGDLSKDDIEIRKFKLNFSKLRKIWEDIRDVNSKRILLYEEINPENTNLGINRPPELDAIDKELFNLVNQYNAIAEKDFTKLVTALMKLQLPEEAGLVLKFSEGMNNTLSTLGFGDGDYMIPDQLRVKNVYQGYVTLAWVFAPPRARKMRWTNRNMVLSDLVRGFAKTTDAGMGFKGDFTDEHLKTYLTNVYD